MMRRQQLSRQRVANHFTILFSFVALLLAPSVLKGQIQGKVYRDFNANGVFDSTATFKEIGLSGITVTAYNAAGTSAGTTTTNATGNYTIPSVSGALRVEFTGLGTGDYSGPRAATGTNFSNTNVQFVTAPTTLVNYGVNYPDDYCQSNPKITFPCYDNGSGAGNTNPVIVQINYDDTNSGSNVYYTGATADAVGSVFGVAYDRRTKLAYYSAFLKRQVGIGDRGYDGIYVVNAALATPALAGGIDLEGVVPSNGGAALAFGTVTRNLIASGSGTGTNDLSADRTQASRDANAYAKVGKVGYGGIDIDADTKTLWAVNLNERSLVAIDISTNLYSTTIPNTVASSKVKRYFIDGTTSPSISGLPTCTNGVMRPFGLKIYKGKGYLGTYR